MDIYDALRAYWGVSLVWNRGQGEDEKPLTVERAIRHLNEVRAFCKGKRGGALKLEQRANNLCRAIVYRNQEPEKDKQDAAK